MKYFVVNLWTSLGPKIIGGGHETEQEAIDSIKDLRASGVKHSNGQLAIIRLTI